MATTSDRRFEASDPRFDPAYGQPAPPPGKRSAWKTCFLGCLVVAALVMLLFLAVAYWVWQNWRELAATGAAEGMNQMIDSTQLPAEERREMKAEVRRVAEAFRAGRLSHEQLARIVQNVVRSPLLTLFVASAVEKQYFDQSGLSDEEKAEGRLALERFVRGLIDKKIDQGAIDRVFKHIGDKQPDGTWELREKVSDEALRAALDEARRAADDAGIPDEPERVDPSAEFKRIVDEAMER
jgi:hypothetical protein